MALQRRHEVGYLLIGEGRTDEEIGPNDVGGMAAARSALPQLGGEREKTLLRHFFCEKLFYLWQSVQSL